MRVLLQPAFVMHSRFYRDTSIIVDVFSYDYGRISLLAKGQRGSKKGKRFPLEPFAKLLLSWQGRGELKLLTAAEVEDNSIMLRGHNLYCGFYCNELLMRLLPVHDAHPVLFDSYFHVLRMLSNTGNMEVELRQFEIHLLNQLGYGINFDCVVDNGEAIDANKSYEFVPDVGFVGGSGVQEHNKKQRYFGRDLIAISKNDYSDPDTLRSAKHILRQALAPHLGEKPIASRELFQKSIT